MAASDSEEFESADEDYEYKEQKTPLKKHTEKKDEHSKQGAEDKSTKDPIPSKESKTVESEIKIEENTDESHNNKLNELTVQESHVSEDGWDDFGEEDEDWIDTIPENHNKIDLNKTNEEESNASNTTPILNKSAISESLPESSTDKVHSLPNTNEKNEIENESRSSWSGWKPWGGIVSSVFSAASGGVTTLTTLIESGIGAPDPEILVKIDKENENTDSVTDDKPIKANNNQDAIPSLGNLVLGVTNIGNKVITGGLDTLEGIGKKTMNILQENDPLLLQKRKFMGLESERPILSQVLREAKEKSEEVEKNMKQMQKQAYKKQLHFESLFDNYYGLVHLEALEMLSKQAAIKLQSLLGPLSGKALAELKETLNEVNELCDLGDFDVNDTEEPFTCNELQEKLDSAIEDLGIDIKFGEILKCWKQHIEQLDNTNIEPQQIYEYGLRCLAETCALQINKMHKIAELLIIKEHHSTANEADSLVQMTTIFCYHLHGIANTFCRKLNTFEQNEELSSLITNLFLEVCNSTTYVQSAFKLFIPILQVGAA